MASNDRLADPTDLDGLREALAASDPEGRLAPIGMKRIEEEGSREECSERLDEMAARIQPGSNGVCYPRPSAVHAKARKHGSPAIVGPSPLDVAGTISGPSSAG